MTTLRISIQGLSFSVRSDAGEDLEWLADFLSPSFGATHDTLPEIHVSLMSDRSELQQWRQAAAESAELAVAFVLDTGVLSLPVGRREDRTSAAYDALFDVAYLVNKVGDTRIIDGHADGPNGRRARAALMRVVREYATSSLLQSDSSLLHGAGVVLEGKATLIAGAKRSGKTSLLSALLGSFGSLELLANDRIILSGRKGEVRAAGMPSIVSVRSGSLDVVPGLAQRLSAVENDYVGKPLAEEVSNYLLTPAQYAALFQVPLAASSDLRNIVFPVIDLQQADFSVLRLSAEESRERVRSCTFAREHLGTHSELFAVPASDSFPSAGELEQRLELMTQGIPCFEVRMGPRFYNRGALERFVELIAD